MNEFGTLGDSLGMGSCDAPVAIFADGDRYIGRERQAHALNHHALSRHDQRKPMGGPQLLTLTMCLRAFSNLFDTLFAKKSILK